MTKLYVNEIAPRDSAFVAVPGHVIQTVQTTSGTQTINTTTTYIDTTLTAKITPTKQNSKILVLISGAFFVEATTVGSIELHSRITRNVTAIKEFPRVVLIRAANYSGILGNGNQGSLSYLDSPTSITELTYTLQIAPTVTGESGRLNKDAIPTSTITLMEIAQ